MPAVPMFAVPGSDQLAAFAVKCLAVAGGFLAGYVIGGTAAWALDKWAFARKSPDFVKKAIRVLTGIALALLIALIVFGEGGGGLFGGGGGSGQGEGKGSPTTPNDGKKADQKARPKPPEHKSPPQPDGIHTPEVKPGDVFVRVRFLSDEAPDSKRLYRLDDSDPLTFDQLKAAILKKKPEGGGRVFIVPDFPEKNPIARDSKNVTQVYSWAENTPGLGIHIGPK